MCLLHSKPGKRDTLYNLRNRAIKTAVTGFILIRENEPLRTDVGASQKEKRATSSRTEGASVTESVSPEGRQKKIASIAEQIRAISYARSPKFDNATMYRTIYRNETSRDKSEKTECLGNIGSMTVFSRYARLTFIG